MEVGKNAREIALLALSAGERQGAWSDGFLKKAIRDAGLDGRDAALCTRLCYGVLQNRMLLDFHLSAYSSTQLEKLEDRVLQCLRIGAYQILFLDRVPHSAAVNESVNLARKYARNPRASGLVNGVLRNLSRNAEELPEPEDLSTRYSHPSWLVTEFSAAIPGGNPEPLLAADNSQPPTMAQVNTCQTTTEQATASLLNQGVAVEAHPWLPHCLLLTETGSVERLDAFQKGWIYIQDPAARLAVMAAGAAPGMRVLDACAAPGGKTFALATQMENQGEILSCDIHPHKEKLIQAGANRLGFSCIKTAVIDAKKRQDEFVNQFDLVLADVPCSGLGIIRKKPDIRYKDPAPLSRLPEIQRAILENVADYVRPGGVLLYVTCTVLDQENCASVYSFLKERTDFALEAFQLPEPVGAVNEGLLTLWPHIHGTDGFFFAKLRRRLPEGGESHAGH